MMINPIAKKKKVLGIILDNLTTIRIQKELNKQLDIISRLEDCPKEKFTDNLIKQGLKPYLTKWQKLRFK